MKRNNKWIFGYGITDMEEPDRDYIKQSVREKLKDQKGEIIMNKRKIKPLFIAIAAAATAFASIAVVNAATDGAVVEKLNETIGYITVKINGKEIDAKGHIVSEDENTVIYEFEIDDSELSNSGKIEISEEIVSPTGNSETDDSTVYYYSGVYTDEISEE